MKYQIPDSWVRITLEKLFTFVLGGDWGKDEDFDDPGYEKVLCIRASELRNWEVERGETAALRKIKKSSLEKRELYEGDILVEISGGGPDQPVGRTVLIDKAVLSKSPTIKKICTNFFRLARPIREIDSSYLNHYLQHFYKSGNISEYQAGSNNLRNLKFNDYLQIEIPTAPLNEQKRIVAKIEELLSELDNGIAALITAREQLKVYRQAVLKHAFEGQLTAKWREENINKLESPEQLLARIQQEREARYQQQLEDWKLAVKAWEISEKVGKKPGKPKIAKLPKDIEQEIAQVNSIQGWYLAPLEVLITEINQGWSPTCELNRTPNDGGWAVIKTSALQPLQYISEECKPLPPEFEPRPGLEVQVGDILMTRKGPRIRTGVVCLVKETRKNSMLCDTVYRFRAIDKAVDSEFLELALNSPAIVSELDQRKSGISDSGISLNHGKLKSIPIPISSSFEEQKLVVSLIWEKIEYINRMDLEIDNQLLRSETLRQSILKKAFSGQLVPQDPNDEPASELLARIQAEREATKTKSTKKARKEK